MPLEKILVSSHPLSTSSHIFFWLCTVVGILDITALVVGEYLVNAGNMCKLLQDGCVPNAPERPVFLQLWAQARAISYVI